MRIQECREAGLSKTATAQRLAMDRGTVAKYWDVLDAPASAPAYQRASKIEPYKEYITDRLNKLSFASLSPPQPGEFFQIKPVR